MMRSKCLDVVWVVIVVGSSRSVLGGVLGDSLRVVVVVFGVLVENFFSVIIVFSSWIVMWLLRVMERFLFFVLLFVVEVFVIIFRCVLG